MTRTLFALCLALSALALTNLGAAAAPRIEAREIAAGLTSPLTVVSAHDDSQRLFIVDQIGVIRVLDAQGNLLTEPFLDLRDRIVPLNPTYDERGLLGLAFHPNYRENGRFFVKYSAPLREGGPDGWDHTNVVAEFRVSENDPNRADPASERLVLAVDHPQSNHNSGPVEFGPDGYLYFAEGDGGGANDVGMGHNPVTGNGQDIDVLLGKILRIDVDQAQPYTIPPTNPFVGTRGADEIYAYGFRNPYGLHFEMGGEHRLMVGDAGQNLWEEVDVAQLGGNFGWNIREGTHCFDPNHPNESPPDCPDHGYFNEPLLDPVVEFPNSANPEGGLGVTVVGGTIYHGKRAPELRGDYIFATFSRNFAPPDGGLYRAFPNDGSQGLWDFEELQVLRQGSSIPGRLGMYIKGFGQSDAADLFVAASDSLGPAGASGRVFRIGSDPFANNQGDLRRDDVAWVGETGTPGRVSFQLDQPGHVSVGIYDVTGRAVRSLLDSDLPAGTREVAWDGKDADGAAVPSGIYFYRLLSDQGEGRTRILIVH